MLLYFIAGLVPLVFFVFLYLRWSIYNFWKNRGVPTPPFSYIVGNLGSSIILKQSLGQTYSDIYNKYEGYNYVGFYHGMRPGILVRSPDLARDILTKSFKNFHDNDVHVDEKVDKVFGKNPFALKGDRWKTTRNQVTHMFSASKLKAMLPLLEANGKKLVRYLETNGIGCAGGLESKELCSKFTCENVASCAFGLEGRSFIDEKAEIREHGRKLTEPGLIMGIKITIVLILPFLAKFLNIKFTPDSVRKYFKHLVVETSNYREKEGVIRGDFLDLMMEMKRKINNEKEFCIDDIVAHAGGFFLDAYETNSVAISYTVYELAAHPDVQAILRDEIREILHNNNGNITYEALNEMKYLDCVIKESLRKNVPLMVLQKICTETYTLPSLKEDGTGPTPTIHPGTAIAIPADALHMDAKYFANPEEFNPDRFSDENKDDITKFAYLPFGEGPRMCLGQRFAILQTKVGIISIFSNFKVTVNKKTQEPIKVDPQNFLRSPVGKLWLNFSKIDN